MTDQLELPLAWRSWIASFADAGKNATRQTVVARDFTEASKLATAEAARVEGLGELIKVEIGPGRGATILPPVEALGDELHRAVDAQGATRQ